MEEDAILRIIYGGADTQFDPDVVGAFKEVYSQGTISSYMENGQLD
jgi:response regulator RpfG family c-di-GMP phosphodiesterase